MVLQPGSWVTETVRLEHRIASGGMGEIWQGEHVRLGVKVAVKCMLPSIAKRTGALSRFLAEAQIAALLNDPHTVRVLDCIVRDGPDGEQSAFIVMELLAGEDLGTYLERTGPLSLDETTNIVQQVAGALGTAHELGIAHRDVKPENVFIERRGGSLRVKLLDFGVAKDLARAGLTMAGVTVGTPQFMSPEQLQGARDVDVRCDVWSLAVLAFACLTGYMPFEGRTVDAVSESIHDGTRRSACGHRGDLPSAVDAVFLRAFQTGIEARFQRAQDFADALNDASRGVASSVEPARSVLAVSTSRICVIGEGYEPAASIPFELLRPSPSASAAPPSR